jgi:hypothetical protein
MILTADQVEELENFCDEHDYDFRSHYSGRGMMGNNCIGFVTDDHPFKVGMKLSQNIMGDLLTAFIITVPESDCMGKSEIIYFPNLSVDKT